MRLLYSPDEPPAGGKEPEKAPEGAGAPQSPPDPYAGLTEDQADIARRNDGIWHGLDFENRSEVLRLAWERQQDLKKPPDPVAPADKGGNTQAATATATKTDEHATAMEKRLAALEAEREQAKKAEQNRLSASRFEAELDGVLEADEGLKGDAELREELKTAYVGHFLKHHDADIAAGFKRYIKRFNDRVEKQAARSKGDYIEEKIKTARETRGETKAGTAPAALGKPHRTD